MAGNGSRFTQAGYIKPKPFIDMKGKPMIVHTLENLAHPQARFILIARREHMAAEAQLVEKIQNQFNVIFVAIDNITEGSACSVLFAHKYINNEQPLLIANSDQIIDIRIAEFISDCQQRNLDGSILTFIDNNLDPKWSYAKLDDDQLVSEVQEKKPISNFATVGIYLFQQGHYFVDAAIEMIIKQDRVNNEYYTCPAYNYIIQSGKKIGIYNIPVEKMHGIGTPTDFEKYLITL